VPPSVALRFVAAADGGSGIAEHVITLDGHDLAPMPADACATGTTCAIQPPAALADGVHRWSVTARDRAGNTTASATATFTVDATAPDPPTLEEPADGARIGSATPELRWADASDAGSGIASYEVSVDGMAPTRVTGQSLRLPAAADGVHTWQTVAVDGAGNRSAPAARSFRIDTTAPTAAVKVSPGQFVPPYEVTVDAGASSDPDGRIVRYEFDLDGDGVYERASAGPRLTTVLSTPGTHVIGVRVIDEVGLTATARGQATGEGTVQSTDTKAAYVSIDSGTDYTSDLDVALDINPAPHSGAVTMVISNDGRPDEGTRIAIARHVPHWRLADGDGLRDRRTVYVSFYNQAGFEVNNGRVQDDILYDPYPPSVHRAVVRRSSARSILLTMSASDRGSGLAKLELRAGHKVIARRSHVGNRQTLKTKTKLKHLSLRVYDKAGNVTQVTPRVRR
jgi:Bacterial Ig-like domain